MKCGKCEFARIDLKDDEDVYYCPFDNKFAFHSGEECHHPYERKNSTKQGVAYADQDTMMPAT